MGRPALPSPLHPYGVGILPGPAPAPTSGSGGTGLSSHDLASSFPSAGSPSPASVMHFLGDASLSVVFGRRLGAGGSQFRLKSY